MDIIGHVTGFRVKEGLSCVIFCAIALRKTRNLALRRLKNPIAKNGIKPNLYDLVTRVWMGGVLMLR